MKNIFLIPLFLSVIFLAGCQTKNITFSEAQPAQAGMDQERLALIGQHINKYIDEKKIPGGVFLVARKGKIVYYENFGDKDESTPYQKDDIFRIASMTKAITTVAIMQLYEKGELGLDDPVHKYIPAFANQSVLETFNETDSSYTTVPVKKPVTIRHLLTHTSGIAYGDFYPGKIKAVYNKFNMIGVGLSHKSWTTEEFINKLAKAPLIFQPGEKYMYGLNMDVLGRVVEVISGQPYNQYLTENIFTPLGMDDTYFYLPQEKHNRLAKVYTPTKEGYKLLGQASGLGAVDYPLKSGLSHFAGGGGLSSTAIDYARFIQALANNGELEGTRILGRKTIEVMSSDQMVSLNEKGQGYSNYPGLTFCLGFSLISEKAKGLNSKSVGTYEWGGYFNTKFFIDPQEELIFVGMTQIVPFRHKGFWDKMYAIIYGAIDD